MNERKWIDENRKSWNAATSQHNSHKGDQAAFLRGGGSTLFPEEIALLGDIEGKKLLHLQCNSGQDTLSIASQLRAEVTGVDLSDEAIRFARQLSLESGIAGNFIQADVYDWLAQNGEQFDIVFTSYGAIMWLFDLERWAAGVAKALKPGGRLVLIEFHPMIGLLDGALDGNWEEACDYMGGTHYAFDEGIGDYVAEAGGAQTSSGEPVHFDQPYVNPHPSHEFSWGLGDVVTALLGAKLTLQTLHEYPYCNGFKPFSQMVELPGRQMVFGPDMPVIPLMYAVSAMR